MNISQKGIAIYLSLMITTVLLAIALGTSTIFIGQIKIIRAMGNSVVAFYAADTGIEAVLMYREDPFLSPAASCTESTPCPLGEAWYYLDIIATGESGCTAQTYCIKSIGFYQGIRRAIEIAY